MTSNCYCDINMLCAPCAEAARVRGRARRRFRNGQEAALLQLATVSTSQRVPSCPLLSPQRHRPSGANSLGRLGYRSGAISLTCSALKNMKPRFADPRLTTWLCRHPGGGPRITRTAHFLQTASATAPATVRPRRLRQGAGIRARDAAVGYSHAKLRPELQCRRTEPARHFPDRPGGTDFLPA